MQISIWLPVLKPVYIVTHMPIARQRLAKHIPEAYALNNKTSIAR
jgi:hypothetical protein